MPKAAPKESAGLHYVGSGAAFPDFPARDLSDDELAEISARLIEQAAAAAATVEPDVEAPKLPTARSIRRLLIDSGLYVEATTPAAPETSEG